MNMKQDLINRLRLETDEWLTKLHVAMVEKNDAEVERIKGELSTIHDTLTALGHYPASVKVAVEV